ncbi:hypothetical protein HDV05_003372 [Chytridiales sp. JEL 0842]|nr:hypothetical protein HDV05_003372 [Chytridiales sp. JEL 0842]
MLDRYLDVPSLSTASALLLLAAYCTGDIDEVRLGRYLREAIQMALQLRLNVETGGDEEKVDEARLIEKEAGRRLWWHIYAIDRYCGLGYKTDDGAMVIKDEDCSIYFPCNHAVWDIALSNHDPLQIAVVSSAELYMPGLPNQSYSGYFVLLMKLLGRVANHTIKYRKLDRKSTSAIANLDLECSIIDDSFQAWYKSLPGDFRDTSFVDLWDIKTVPFSSWITLWNLFVYHGCRLILHRPKMMDDLRRNPNVVTKSPSYLICLDSSNETTTLIRKVLISNPSFACFPGACGFFAYQTGLMHVMSGILSSDETFCSLAVSKANEHLKAVGAFGKTWFAAAQLYAGLSRIIDIVTVEKLQTKRRRTARGPADSSMAPIAANMTSSQASANTPPLPPGFAFENGGDLLQLMAPTLNAMGGIAAPVSLATAISSQSVPIDINAVLGNNATDMNTLLSGPKNSFGELDNIFANLQADGQEGVQQGSLNAALSSISIQTLLNNTQAAPLPHEFMLPLDNLELDFVYKKSGWGF